MEWWESSEVRQGVPFAVDSGGTWRDVDDVPNGKQCGCYCGDCHGPLIARQGEVRAHHFAHDDRRECRNALEASLFGMAINLLAEQRAVLAMPGFGDRRQLAISAGVASRQLARLPTGSLVVPSQKIPMEGAEFRASSLAESRPDAPDIFIPGSRIAVHFLSVSKNVRQAEEAPAASGVSVLGLNLRSYAQLWWQVCDSEKEQRIKAASMARELMRRWLTEYVMGRGWLHHPAVVEEKQRLEQLARLREPSEPEPKFHVQPFSERDTRDPLWMLPTGKSHPQPGASGWVATGQGLVPATPEFMKAIRPECEGSMTAQRAAEVGLHWHARHGGWFFVGMAEDAVPLRVRRFLDAESSWKPVMRDDHENLTRPAPAQAARPENSPADSSTTDSSTAAPSPQSETAADEILVPNVGVCYCGKPTQEVRIASGYFEGRRAVTCSSGLRHPFKLL